MTGAVRPGATVPVTGSGFAASESVTLTLASDPEVVVTLPADGTGRIAGSVTVPADAADGTYPLTALGSVSNTPAGTSVEVAAATPPATYSPELRVLAASSTPGSVVAFDGSGFAPGETVTLRLTPGGAVLGSAIANPDGIVTGSFHRAGRRRRRRLPHRGIRSRVRDDRRRRLRGDRQPVPDGGTRPAQGGGWQGLAYTGVETEQVTWPAVGGAALLLGGLAAVGAAFLIRRRREHTV